MCTCSCSYIASAMCIIFLNCFLTFYMLAVVDALVVALDLLRESSQVKKFTSLRLMLFSDLGGEFSDDRLEDFIAALKEKKVEVNFM